MHNYFFELQNRIFYILIMFFLILFLSYFYKEALFYFLAKPVIITTSFESNTYFIYTHVTEVFLTYLKFSALTGLYLTIPFCFYQSWKFFLPGFYYSEQPLLNYALTFFILIWCCTNILTYFCILPYIWFFFSEFSFFSSENLIPFFFEAKLNDYLNFVTQTFFSSFLIFEIFLLIFLLLIYSIKSNLKFIKKIRPYFYLITFLFACFITPPDIFSQLIVATPFIILYESILCYIFLKNEYQWLNVPLIK